MFAFLIFDKARNESAHDYSLFEDDNNQNANFDLKINNTSSILYSTYPIYRVFNKEGHKVLGY